MIKAVIFTFVNFTIMPIFTNQIYISKKVWKKNSN